MFYGIIFFILFPDNLLLMYRNAADFTLYSATLLTVLIRSNSFGGGLRFSLCKVTSAADRNNRTSSFPTLRPSLPFCCLMVLARTSTTTWSRSGESGHACLVLDCKGSEKVVFKQHTP